MGINEPQLACVRHHAEKTTARPRLRSARRLTLIGLFLGSLVTITSLSIELAPIAQGQPLDDWTPQGSNWTLLGENTVQSTTTISNCDDIITARAWDDTESEFKVSLTQISCRDSSSAQAMAAATISDLWASPAGEKEIDSTVLAVGADYTFTVPASSGTMRLWAQGTTFYLLMVTGGDSDGQMEVNTLQSTYASHSAPGEVLNLDAALYPGLMGWTPVGQEWQASSVDRTRLGDEAYACSLYMNQRVWRSPAEDYYVLATVIPCATLANAITVSNFLFAPQSADNNAQLVFNRTDRVYTNDGPQPAVMRLWIQGTDIYMLSIVGETGQDLTAINIEHSLAFEETLPGEPQSTLTFASSAASMIISSPVSWYFMIWLCVHLIIHVGRDRGSMNPWPGVPNISAVDLQGPLSSARRRRFWRRVCYWIGIPSVVAVVMSLIAQAFGTSDLNTPVQAWVFAALGVVLLIMLPFKLKPSSVEARRSNPGSRTLRGVAGITLRMIAQVLFVAAILAYLVVSFMAVVFQDMVVRQDPTTTSDDRRVALVTLLRAIGPMGLFLILIAIIGLLYLLDRLGKRLRSRSLREAQAAEEAQGRKPFLLLRSFDEDKLKLPARLRVGGALGAANLVHRVRFEEVVANQLARYGPLVAVSPPNTLLPPLGAARVTLKDDDLIRDLVGVEDADEAVMLARLQEEYAKRGISLATVPDLETCKRNLWQLKVADLAADARTIVVSATPESIQPGFQYELWMTSHVNHQRILLLIAPWKKQLQPRWQRFLHYVGDPRSNTPVFAELTRAYVPLGAQVLAHKPGAGWRAFGTEQRIDWSYAMCLEQAVAWLDEPQPDLAANPVPIMAQTPAAASVSPSEAHVGI